MNEQLRALNRFGLGARVGECERIGEPRAWLRDQLEAVADAGSAPDPDEPVSLEEALEALGRLRRAARSGDRDETAEARRALRDIALAETTVGLSARLESRTPFVERLVAFWSNHLCVSAAKPQVLPLAGHYERTVIRPHVLGRFEEMVLASARHPAMLLYLDNAQSVGPRSWAGTRTARSGNARGLNENYARELLELHTLGVDAGYGQADVEALARILTGWGVDMPGQPGGRDSSGGAGGRGGRRGATGERGGRRGGGSARLDAVTDPAAPGFVFRPALHEPGSKTVLDVLYRESGVEEGEAAIRDLCAHPSTAFFLAEKLVRHFVSDAPPPDAIEEIAGVFRSTRGDLLRVSRALVDLESAWAPDADKFRTPQEWLISSLRALEVSETPDAGVAVLRQLRHTPWAPPSPKGYPDVASAWSDPDSLMNRAELARTLTRGEGPGRRLAPGADSPMLDAPELLLDVVDVTADDPLRALLADRSIDAEERLALGLAGPAFQWR